MKLAISNIAWEATERDQVADLLKEFDVQGIEVAPTKVWDKPLEVSDSQVREFRSYWERRNIQIVSVQSVLFGQPHLTIFDSKEKRLETQNYLSQMIELSGQLGAKAIVFGSPRNRKIGERDAAQVAEIAEPFFRQLGVVAERCQTCFCVEPNPIDYGCDFVTNTKAGQQLVSKVDHPGFRLHLDSGAIHLAGDSVADAITSSSPLIRHFHISEPGLAPIGTSKFDHQEFGNALRRISYRKWVSIEMRPSDGGNLAPIRQALETVQSTYFQS